MIPCSRDEKQNKLLGLGHFSALRAIHLPEKTNLMKTTKGKITTKIAFAFAIIAICALIVFWIVPFDKPEDKVNVIIGVASAISIFTVFSIFATIQEEKKQG